MQIHLGKNKLQMYLKMQQLKFPLHEKIYWSWKL